MLTDPLKHRCQNYTQADEPVAETDVKPTSVSEETCGNTGDAEQFISSLANDIRSWLDVHESVFANERDLQVKLALYLSEGRKYDKIHLEYRVPVVLLKHKLVEKGRFDSINDTKNPYFPWSNSSNYFLDIVVEKNGMYVPIELKYGTREIDHKYTLFDQKFTDVPVNVKTKIVLLNEQAASDLTMYNYWKDVRRLEVMSEIFRNIVGGIALIITNCPAYWQKPRATSGYLAFSTHTGNVVGGGHLSWGESIGTHIRDTHPEFRLDTTYQCRWDSLPVKATRNGNEEKFQYFMTVVGIPTQEIASTDKIEINPPSNNIINLKEMARKSAISGEYIITQEDNGSIRVCQIFDNVIASLREAAKSVGFKIEPNWKTTQGIGKKMVDALGDGYTAEAGEYTIVRRDSGHIDTYRVHGNTKKVLNTIASAIDFPMNPGWNTRTAGSKLIDFINGDYTPENAAEPEEEMFEIRPDMTILELFENFKAQFGGHLRIKDGVKRCDPHWNHQTTAVWVPVTEGTLEEIGCKSPGKFSVDMKVGEFQDEVKKVCGITVIVATPDNYVTVLPEFTLDAVNILPPALTKAKMQDILDR